MLSSLKWRHKPEERHAAGWAQLKCFCLFVDVNHVQMCPWSWAGAAAKAAVLLWSQQGPAAVPVLPQLRAAGSPARFQFLFPCWGHGAPWAASALARAPCWAGPWHGHLQCSLAVPTFLLHLHSPVCTKSWDIYCFAIVSDPEESNWNV